MPGVQHSMNGLSPGIVLRSNLLKSWHSLPLPTCRRVGSGPPVPIHSSPGIVFSVPMH